MMHDFIASWPLFANTYLTGWLLAVLLSMMGVYVVARDQIFVGAAIAQASTLGIALSMVAASCLPGLHLHALEGGATLWAVVFACAAAYAMSLAFGRRESHEAVAAWIFLAGGSWSVLVVAHSPHGLDEIHRLVSSSLIGATAAMSDSSPR
jgi:ABC-type Mn2+/Zn2+ transport system permease subunit